MSDVYKVKMSNYPDTNFETIMDNLTPTVLAVLLSESVSINTCKVCSQKIIRDCDHRCMWHMREWLLNTPTDDSVANIIHLIRAYADNSDSIMEVSK